MTKRPRMVIFLAELAIVSANFFVLYYFLQHIKHFYYLDLIDSEEVLKHFQPINLYLNVFYAAVPLWGWILWWRGQHLNLHTQSYAEAGRHLIISGVMFLVCFASVSFLLKFEYLSRIFIFSYMLTSTFWLIVNRIVFLNWFKEARRRGEDVQHLLLAGTGRRAQEFISDISKHAEWGYELVGLLDRDPALRGQRVAGYPVLGTLEDLPSILETRVIDELFFVTPRSWLEDVRKCILYCEAVGVPATISTDLFDFEIASGLPKKLEGRTYLTVKTPLLKSGERFLKRVFDNVTAALILILSSPLLFAVACAVKLTSPGPVFFRQIRVGRNGRRFHLYKFRSMVLDAEHKLHELKTSNEMSGPVFKIAKDPRITPLGRFLRKTSLDEFPQLWNVLKGDMSLVGPRPPLPSEVAEYEPWQRRRLSMQPGVTCIWQATRRHGIDFEEWMEMDLRYIDNWALWLDIKILLLTVRAVFAATGK